jgi:hypothetical protein
MYVKIKAIEPYFKVLIIMPYNLSLSLSLLIRNNQGITKLIRKKLTDALASNEQCRNRLIS